MDTEFAEIALEQRERTEERPLPAFAPQPEPMLPAPLPARARPRGRPFVKGQSGNPAGRPRRIHPSAAAIDYVIGRKSIRLARKVRDMALKGDRAMLKLWYQNAAAAQRASPDWPQMPL